MNGESVVKKGGFSRPVRNACYPANQTTLNYSRAPRANPRWHYNQACMCGCSSVDRVLASEAKGRGFDPRQPHHFIVFTKVSYGR